MRRRTFLKGVGATALAMAAATPYLRAQDATSGPYTVALIGSGWWGMNILRAGMKAGNIKVVALCDCDAPQMDKCAQEIKSKNGDEPKKYGDYRELLEKEKPRIVINATPDHWHARITIDAIRGGSHVYVEKPISHTILEGTAMVKAARDANAVVQVGTHRRVSPHNISAREFVRSGKLGKVGMVKCYVHNAGGPEKPTANVEAPAGLNWDMYCGPAPLRPFNKKIHPRGFRQFLDFANGNLGDWGVHWIDQALWIMDAEHPHTVYSAGGRPVRGPVVNTAEQQTTDAPDHQVATFEFENFTCTWEHLIFGGTGADKNEGLGAIFYGSEGVLQLGWGSGWTFFPSASGKATEHADAQASGDAGDNILESWKDFVDAIEKKRRPVSDIETAHRATTCSLLGMISMKLGRSVKWDGEKQTIPNDAEAAALLRRNYRGEWKYPEV